MLDLFSGGLAWLYVKFQTIPDTDRFVTLTGNAFRSVMFRKSLSFSVIVAFIYIVGFGLELES